MGGAGVPPDDAAVLASAASGEAWALTVLYRQLQPALVRFLTGLAGDDAEDLAAEAWIDAARALPSFAGDGRAFRSLLFTIGRRRAIDRLRQHRRRRTQATDPARLPETAAGDVAEAVVELDASTAAVRRIARLLPRDQAEVVLLRVVAGLDVPRWPRSWAGAERPAPHTASGRAGDAVRPVGPLTQLRPGLPAYLT